MLTTDWNNFELKKNDCFEQELVQIVDSCDVFHLVGVVTQAKEI